MADGRTSTLQLVFLATAAALGVALLGTSHWAAENLQWGLIGLPITAASASALVYRKHAAVAAIALAVGVALATASSAQNVLIVAPAALAVLAAIVLLPRVSYLWVGSGLVALFTLGGLGFDVALARAGGNSLGEQVVTQAKAMSAQFVTVLGPQQGAEFGKQVVEAYRQTVAYLPSAYFLAGMLLAVAVVAAIAWSARRLDVPVNVPAFQFVDLPPVVVLGAVVAVLMLGFARLAPSNHLWGVVGWNVMLCTSYLLLIQGLAVYSALLKRAHVRAPGRVAAYVVLLVLDLLLHFISLTGLADMWLNFRRLPREGRPDLPLKPVTSPGDESSGA